MSGTSSINFQPVQSNSEAHNQRLQKDKNGYIKAERSHLNEKWVSDSIKDRRQFVEARCKELSGRKLQKNATPIREGVLNIKSDTSMEDLMRLKKVLKEKYDIDVFQIYIHRDEGRVVDGEMKLNHHAHILADWTDPKKGKMLRLNKQDMRDIQTLTAEVLDMKRGKPSDLEHLTVNEYKAQQIAKEKVLQEYGHLLDTKKKEILEVESIRREKVNEAFVKKIDSGFEWKEGMFKSSENKESFQKLKQQYEELITNQKYLKRELKRRLEVDKQVSSASSKVAEQQKEINKLTKRLNKVREEMGELSYKALVKNHPESADQLKMMMKEYLSKHTKKEKIKETKKTPKKKNKGPKL